MNLVELETADGRKVAVNPLQVQMVTREGDDLCHLIFMGDLEGYLPIKGGFRSVVVQLNEGAHNS